MLGKFGLSGHHHLVPIVKLSGARAHGGRWRRCFCHNRGRRLHMHTRPHIPEHANDTRHARVPAGGQKARVVFASIALSEPHILLLDEPTNHLDMQSIDALCDAVEEFGGGVVVISHDAQLLSRLCADEERSQVGVEPSESDWIRIRTHI